MDIIELYNVLLQNCGMKADSEGFISANLTDTMTDPILVDDKRMVLPTHNQLATPNIGNRVVFHPLHESLIRGESEVMAETRRVAVARLNISFTYIGYCLMQLATSPAEHARLTPDQAVFLDNIKDIDEGIMEVYSKLMQQMAVGEDGRSFVRIFIKRGGKIGGKAVQRLAVVHFPFYEELIKKPASGQPNILWGVRLKKAEREALIRLVEYMVPNIGIPEHYNRGSDSTVAPTLDALMQGIGTLGAQINDLIDLFGESILQDGDAMRYNLEWREVFTDLRQMQKQINMIPAQPGNEGSMPQTARPQVEVPGVVVTKKEEAPWEGESQFKTNQAAPSAQQEETAAPAPSGTGPAADTGFFKRPATIAAAPAPQAQQYQRVVRPVAAPAPMVATGYRPVAPQPYQPPQVPVVNSFLPPHLQYQAAMMQGSSPFMNPQMAYQQRQPQQHIPLWARGSAPGYSSGYGSNNLSNI